MTKLNENKGQSPSIGETGTGANSEKPAKRFDGLTTRIKQVWQGAIPTADHLLSDQDVVRVSALTTSPTKKSLEELLEKVKKNRRRAGIVRATALGLDNLVLREIESGDAFTNPKAVIYLLASVFAHAYEYSFRNKSQDSESLILEQAFAELLSLHKESLATISLPEGVLRSFPRSAATAIANAERAKGASALEMVGVMSITTLNTLSLHRYLEAMVLTAMTTVAVPTLRLFYLKFKKMNEEHRALNDSTMALVGQEYRSSDLTELAEVVDRLSNLKTSINILQRGLAHALQLLAFISEQLSYVPVNLGFASALAGMFTDAVGGAIGMQMLTESGILARERLNDILSHIEEQKLTIKDEETWDKHRESGGKDAKDIPQGLQNSWYIQNFTVGLRYVGEDAVGREDELTFLENSSLSLQKGALYLFRAGSGDGKSMIMKSVAQRLNHNEASQLYSVDESGVAENIHTHEWRQLPNQVRFYEGSDFRSGLSFMRQFWDALFFNEESLVIDFWNEYERESGMRVDRNISRTIRQALDMLHDPDARKSLSSLALRDWMLGKERYTSSELKDTDFELAKNVMSMAIDWKLRTLLVDEYGIFSLKEFRDISNKPINDSMSSGQRARVQLAMIMVERPQLIFADELVARVDGKEVGSEIVSNREVVIRCLLMLVRAGHTIVMSTHMAAEEERRFFGDAEEFGGTIFLRDKKLHLVKNGADEVSSIEPDQPEMQHSDFETPIVLKEKELQQIDDEEYQYIRPLTTRVGQAITDGIFGTDMESLENIFTSVTERFSDFRKQFEQGDQLAAVRMRSLADNFEYQITGLGGMQFKHDDPRMVTLRKFIYLNFYHHCESSIVAATSVIKNTPEQTSYLPSKSKKNMQAVLSVIEDTFTNRVIHVENDSELLDFAIKLLVSLQKIVNGLRPHVDMDQVLSIDELEQHVLYAQDALGECFGVEPNIGKMLIAGGDGRIKEWRSEVIKEIEKSEGVDIRLEAGDIDEMRKRLGSVVRSGVHALTLYLQSIESNGVYDSSKMQEANYSDMFAESLDVARALRARFFAGDKLAALELRTLSDVIAHQMYNILNTAFDYDISWHTKYREFIYSHFWEGIEDSVSPALELLSNIADGERAAVSKSQNYLRDVLYLIHDKFANVIATKHDLHVAKKLLHSLKLVVNNLEEHVSLEELAYHVNFEDDLVELKEVLEGCFGVPFDVQVFLILEKEGRENMIAKWVAEVDQLLGDS